MKPTSRPSSVDDLASAWIARRDAGMSASERQEFEAWKAADPRHAAAVARHEQAWRLFDRPLSAGQAADVISLLAQRATRRRRRRVTAVSAALVLMLAIGVLFRMHAPPLAVAAAPTFNSLVRVPEHRTLPDGSIVELKPGAELTVDFSGRLRRVYLTKGEAHFQVAKNPARAFVVTASGVEVRAVGTAFAVELGARKVDVLVTEGTVAIAQDQPATPAATAAPAAAAPTLVSAGKRALITLEQPAATAPAVEAMSAADMANRLSWRAPRLEFTATPLGEAIALLNRYNHTQIIVDPADRSLAQLEVSGFFRADNADTFLNLIAQTLGVRADAEGDKIVLRRAR